MQRFWCLLSLIIALCALPPSLMAQDIAHIAASTCTEQTLVHQTAPQPADCPDSHSPYPGQHSAHIDCCSFGVIAVTHDFGQSIPAMRAPQVGTAANSPATRFIPPLERPPIA